MESSPKSILASLLSEEVSHRPVILSSGKRSDWYIDCRNVTYGQPLATARAVCDFLQEYDLYAGFDAIGGIGYGGIPIAISVAYAWRIPAFGVRTEAKMHGRSSQIAGDFGIGPERTLKGKKPKIVLVDDVFTTGASMAVGVEQAQELGAEVLAAVCLVNRSGEDPKPIGGVRVLSMFTQKDLDS